MSPTVPARRHWHQRGRARARIDKAVARTDRRRHQRRPGLDHRKRAANGFHRRGLTGQKHIEHLKSRDGRRDLSRLDVVLQWQLTASNPPRFDKNTYLIPFVQYFLQ